MLSIEGPTQELSQVAPATSCLLLPQALHHETIITASFARLPSASRGSPGGTSGKEPPYHGRRLKDVDLISGSGRSPGGGHGNPLQFSCLKNPMDRGAWWITVHGVTKSRTCLKQLSTHASVWWLLRACRWCLLHPGNLRTFLYSQSSQGESAWYVLCNLWTSIKNWQTDQP